MEPIANSSIFVLPTITAPAASNFSTAVAVNVGTKLLNILEEQVVNIPLIHILSLMATGTPANGPVSVPSSINLCTSSALANAPSRSIVTNALISLSFASKLSRYAVVASTTDISLFRIFLPSSTAVILKSMLFSFLS